MKSTALLCLLALSVLARPGLAQEAAAAKPTAKPTAKPAPKKEPERKPAPAPPVKPKRETPPAVKPEPAPTSPVTTPTTGPAKPPKKPKKDDSIAFFKDGLVPRLKIQIPDAELQQLRRENREYVRCTIVEDDNTTYENVGIHLKGAAGSFRGIDDRPALTLNFDKFKDDQSFHDLDKIHLNNSVQDPSYLHELVCSELFLAAGVPAARATHARVWLNGRDLGFYVLKEGFNKGFLKRNGLDGDGNLYEGGFVQDLDGQPKLQSGTGVADRSDVKAVIAACREGDPMKRWAAVEKVVDIDRFLSFMAMELITCHWDGYCQNRNNYRFYFDPKSGKIQFFPHGMDQMFGDTNTSVLNVPGAMVANAVMTNPEWRGRYRDRLSELIKLLVPPDRIIARVEEHHQRLRPVLAAISPGRATEWDQRVQELKDHLFNRARSLTQQDATVEARPQRFGPDGAAPLTRWEMRQEADCRLEKLDTFPGAKGGGLSITAGASGRSVGSWRMKLILPAGKYRLEGRAKAQGIKSVADSSGTGAGLRLSGSPRTNKLEGTADWTPLSHEFQIQAPTQEVELVAELRATAGQVIFEAGSLRLVRVP